MRRQKVLPQQPARARPAPQPVQCREVVAPRGLELLGCAAAAVLMAAGASIMRRLLGGSGRGKKRPPRQPNSSHRRPASNNTFNPESRAPERRWS